MNSYPMAGLGSMQLSGVKVESKPPFSCCPDMLQVKHLAEITGLSAQTIRREMHSGHIPSIRIARRLYCPKADFIEYVQSEVQS